MRHPVRLKITNYGLLVLLANHYIFFILMTALAFSPENFSSSSYE